MKKVDLGYLAGIMDGEGCITILEMKNRRKRTWRVHVTIANTNEWLLKWVQFYSGLGGIYKMGRGGKGNEKPSWQWRVSDRPAGDFLRMILPYLKIKKPQAEIALRFQDRMTANYHQDRTNEQIVLDEADSILIRSYNKRGIL